SSMVLELLGTLCVALIAVNIGMRLVYGEMDLAPALAVLVLAPEVYQPLRNVGSQYHASTDGLAAVTATFEVLDEPAPADGDLPAPALATST
ncbi:thiol reductant ABC exporter subunit CydD, partial [Bacillus thuringiensis]|nr:thiol reductant ABC exporter subunit CydD [Bacillus thuringiensis]